MIKHSFVIIEAQLPMAERHARLPIFGDVMAFTGIVVKNRVPFLCFVLDTTIERPNFIDVSQFVAGQPLELEPVGQYITANGTENVIHVFAGVRR